MTARKDRVEAVLKEVQTLICDLSTTLAGIADIPTGVVEGGERLMATVFEAMRNHASGLSINQSKDDVAGVEWWSHRLGDWMFSVLRLTQDNQARFTSVREAMDRADFTCIDRLRSIGASKEITDRRTGSSKVILLEFVKVPDIIAHAYEEDKLACPVQGCVRGTFGTEKAYNRHLERHHKGLAKKFRLKKAINPVTGRLGSVRGAQVAKNKIACMLCEDRMEVNQARYNEHYRARHDKAFVANRRKVSMVFCQYVHIFTSSVSDPWVQYVFGWQHYGCFQHPPKWQGWKGCWKNRRRRGRYGRWH